MTDDLTQSGKNYIKRKDKRKSPRADNFVFRLHYQFTFGILVSLPLSYIIMMANVARMELTSLRYIRNNMITANIISFSMGGHKSCCNNINMKQPFCLSGWPWCLWLVKTTLTLLVQLSSVCRTRAMVRKNCYYSGENGFGDVWHLVVQESLAR